MGMIPYEEKVYDDGRTKQSFADDCDINKMLKKAQVQGSISHLQRFGAEYGDYSDMPDLLEAHERLRKGQAIFDALPSEVKREFGQDSGKFFAYVNAPENASKLAELLPDLAAPGNQVVAPRRTVATETAREALSSPPATPPEGSESSSVSGEEPPASSST